MACLRSAVVVGVLALTCASCTNLTKDITDGLGVPTTSARDGSWEPDAKNQEFPGAKLHVQASLTSNVINVMMSDGAIFNIGWDTKKPESAGSPTPSQTFYVVPGGALGSSLGYATEAEAARAKDKDPPKEKLGAYLQRSAFIGLTGTLVFTKFGLNDGDPIEVKVDLKTDEGKILAGVIKAQCAVLSK